MSESTRHWGCLPRSSDQGCQWRPWKRGQKGAGLRCKAPETRIRGLKDAVRGIFPCCGSPALKSDKRALFHSSSQPCPARRESDTILDERNPLGEKIRSEDEHAKGCGLWWLRCARARRWSVSRQRPSQQTPFFADCTISVATMGNFLPKNIDRRVLRVCHMPCSRSLVPLVTVV